MKTTPSNRSVSVGRRAQVRHHTVSAEALRFEEVETTQAKTCKACGVKKPVSEFHHQALGKFGVTSKCKPCKNAMTKAWEIKNPEQCREKVRNWRANNREHVRENGRIAYAANRKSHIEKQVAWQKRNPESKRINGSRYRVTHSDKIKRWRRENYGMIYAHNAARRALRLKACPPWITEDQKAEMKAIYEKLRFDPAYHDAAYDPPFSDFNMVIDNHGTAVNVTVAQATVRIKFRRSRRIDVSGIEAAVQAAAKRAGVELAERREGTPPELPVDHPLIRLAVDITGKPAATAPYGTDASELQDIAPCVILGPGTIATAHTPRECVALADLAAAVPIFRRILSAGAAG
jgi:hypothetical protein